MRYICFFNSWSLSKSPIMMLSGLMSQWIYPFKWSFSSKSISFIPKLRMHFVVKCFWFMQRISFKLRPSFSWAMYGWYLYEPDEITYGNPLIPFKSYKMWNSLSFIHSSEFTFMTTYRLSIIFFAKYIFPNPPSLIFLIILNLSSNINFLYFDYYELGCYSSFINDDFVGLLHRLGSLGITWLLEWFEWGWTLRLNFRDISILRLEM